MDDIKNIRVTEIANKYLDRLVTDQKLFKDDSSAAKFALAYAIRNDMDLNLSDSSTLEGNTFNKWDTGSFDVGSGFKLIIKLRHPECECPYRIIQAALNLGLEEMNKKSPASGFIRISNFLNAE